MRIKYFFFSLFLIGFVGVCRSQPVSQTKATEIAFRFFNKEVRGIISSSTWHSLSGIVNQTQTTVWKESNRACMYVVNMPDSGWVLVAGDERVKPILAVCDREEFPTKDEMPLGMLELLLDYANEIFFVQDSCPGLAAHPDWQVINMRRYSINSQNMLSNGYLRTASLLNRPQRGEVKWNQNKKNAIDNCSKTYNKFCPDWYDVSCNRTVVGCSAVAMAQIMWYWQWPHTGYISTGIDENGNGIGTMELHLYDWDKMPTELTDATPMEEVDMVAGFLRDCGYAAKMEYGATGSGTTIQHVRTALENTFAYRVDDLRRKNWYTNNRWIELIKSEIDAGRPLYYRGQGDAGGHAFVVDGYSGDYFHVNWGYSGVANGFYSLGNLSFYIYVGNNQYEFHEYNSKQQALFGIQPAPACGSASVNGGNNYRVGVAGEVSVSNLTVPSGQTAVYYSGTSVRLLPGFHASAGSHTHVAIQNFPCSGIAPLSARSADHEDDLEQKTDLLSLERPFVSETLVVYPNPTGGNLTVESSKLINQLELYGLDGEKQMESQGTTIDLHPLQVGMYILVVRFSDGTTRSCKVAKSL